MARCQACSGSPGAVWRATATLSCLHTGSGLQGVGCRWWFFWGADAVGESRLGPVALLPARQLVSTHTGERQLWTARSMVRQETQTATGPPQACCWRGGLALSRTLLEQQL